MTDRTAAILGYIREHVQCHGYAPTLAEIGAAVGMSRQGARHHVEKLQAAGHLWRKRNVPRSITLKGEGRCTN